MLHPKIVAALLAALSVAVVTVGNAFLEVYPNGVVSVLVAALLPVIAGYLKRA